MKFRFLLIALFTLVLNSVDAYAQIAAWDFTGENTVATSTAEVYNAGLDASSSLTRGSGATASAGANSFRTAGFQNNGIAVANNDYFQFTVSATTGNVLSLSSIDTRFAGTNTFYASPGVSHQFAYSLDGTTFILIGSAQTTTSVASVINFDLSGVSALQNVPAATTVTLRYYASGQTTTGGWGFNSPSAGAYGLAVNGTIVSAAISSVTSGDWATNTTWSCNCVPTATDNVVITAGHTVFTSAALTRTAQTTVNGNFELRTGGSASGTNFTYNAATGGLNFNATGAYTVNNGDVFWPTGINTPYNVSVLQGGLTMNATMARSVAGTFSVAGSTVVINAPSTLTINGYCIINTGGSFTNSPIYGSGSTLRYNTGGSFNRSLEWTSDIATIGTTPGYPHNVQLSNNTTLNYYNAGNNGPKGMNGNLTIDSGSTFSFGAVSTAGALTVTGDVSNGGTLSLGSAVGDDLKTRGNFSNTGTFTGNNRAICFIKAAGVQQVSSTTVPLVIPYVVTANGTTVQLLNNVTISAPTNGNAIAFGSSSDVIDLNGNTLIIGTAGVDSVINGTGGFKGSTSSIMTLNGGTGSIGTLKFVTDLNLATLTVNRTSGSIACVMGSNLTLNQAVSLNLNAGIIDLASYTMTLEGIINNAGATNYIIADNTFGGVLRRRIPTMASYTYPIGEKTGVQEYSPAQVNFTAGTFASAYLGMSVNDAKEPNMDATTHYITRYWDVTSSGTFTSPSYTFSATYLAGDVVGTEANCMSNQWNGTTWLNNGGSSVAGSNTITNVVATTVPTTNHFTAGRRDQDINVVQGVTTYLTGSTYNFGTVLTGSNVDVTFTIQNLGQINLTLGATAGITGNPPYSIQTPYTGTIVTAISGTKTFTIRFAPTAAGTFIGSVTIPSDDPNEPNYVINFTGVGQTPAPEINVRAASGGFGNITSGNVTTTNGLQNTAFGSVNLGSNVTKDFEIQNTGTAVLTLSGAPLVSIGGTNPGDFVVTTVPPTSSIATSSSTTFIITFTPQAAGARSAIVSIANNDSDENPYTYLIDGTGVCLTTGNTITPTSGPVGTEITITASTNNLTGATVTVAGTAATPVTQVSSTQIKVTVPSGVINGVGTIVTTNSQGCQASTAFTVIGNASTTCQGGTNASDLFISEVTDATFGGLTYIEIYNGTGASVNLSTYALQFFANGNASSYSTVNLSGTVANGATYTVSTSTSGSECGVTGGNGLLANLTTSVSGVNFSDGATPTPNTTVEHDHIALFKSGTKIDSWGVYMNDGWATPLGIGDRGADFRRKNTATVPKVNYTNADWDVIDWIGSGSGSCSTNDYSNIGTYNFLAGTPPTVTTHPSYTPTCKGTTLTVAGTEGYNGGGDTMELTYQWYAVAPNTATWTALSNNATYSGVNTATLDISDISGLIGYQFYCQIRENASTCYSASNAVMVISGQSTTWNGTAWSNGSPTPDKAVIINGNYDTAVNGDFEACSVTVNGGFSLNIKPNDYVSIVNDLTVSATANLNVENNGSLVMIDDDGLVTNNGTTLVTRTTAPFEQFDYTYWSSPVESANIATTFTGWRTDYSFEFITANFSDTNTIDYYGNVTAAGVPDSFDDFAPWAWSAYTGNMTKAKGYAIMGPTELTFSPSATTSVTFSGKVNNGIIPIAITDSGNVANANDDFNLVGNPYPSAIFADTFITTNGAKTSGSLYFWTHVDDVSVSNPGPDLYNFISDDYAVYNLTGGTRASFTGSAVPNGYIASGTGFFVEAQGNNSLTFNNAMRNKNYANNQFFRTAAAQPALEKDRIWLNLRNADGMFGQLLVGYFADSTLDFDWAYDARVNQSNNYLSFYSLAAAEKLKIQARPSFEESDIVPLGYSSAVQGEFSISIDQREGVLNNEATNIYLEDLELNIIHDLKASPYTFITNSGKYDNRFLLRYTDNALGNTDFDTLENSVIVSSNHGALNIKSYIQAIDEVYVYDILGRQLLHAKEVGANDFNTEGVSLSQQSVIVKIKLNSGTMVTKKVLIN